jgi:hypothetical protein
MPVNARGSAIRACGGRTGTIVVACGLGSSSERKYHRQITQWIHEVTAISDLNACVCDRALLLEMQDQLALGDARAGQWVIICL